MAHPIKGYQEWPVSLGPTIYLLYFSINKQFKECLDRYSKGYYNNRNKYNNLTIHNTYKVQEIMMITKNTGF